MVQPLDVAADPMTLETLVRNLKDLRRSPESGTISGPAESYGLAPPAAVVRLWRSPAESSSSVLDRAARQPGGRQDGPGAHLCPAVGSRRASR